MRRAVARRSGGPPRLATGRREGELRRRLDEAEARYRALAEMLPSIPYASALDVQGAFTYVAPQVKRLLGYEPEELLADKRLWLSRVHPDDRSRVLIELVRAHRGGRGFAAEYRMLDREGRVRWVRDEARAVCDPSGRPLFIQGLWTETTGRRRLEGEISGQRRALASSKAQNQEFASVASHELKAPLRRIVNLSELLAARAGPSLDEESRGMLARVSEAAVRMQELMRALAHFAEQEALPAARVNVDAAAVFDRALDELREEIAATGAEIDRGPLPEVWAEPELLERVFYNLLDNALKFRGARTPRVRAWAERAGGEWVISVRDNGIGIAPGQARRVFAMFDRLPTARSAGAGIGLAVCRNIVESFGGRIWVESELGEGATFRFTLPPARSAR